MATRTKPEHTPGPWEVGVPCVLHMEPGDWHMLPIKRADEAFAEEVCLVHGCHDMTEEAAEANARLIAAAPDLLAACKAMLSIDNPPAYEPGHIDLNTALDMARDAIAKAEGQP